MRGRLSVSDYFDGLRSGDRTTLGRAITLIESSLASDRLLADELLKKCLPFTGESFRLGITGSPGAGKSTFIETFGLYAIEQGKKTAVLAVDPSSRRTGGSILGDKTRMAELSTHPAAYIRPSPAGDALGGVNRRTRETILLCEAAGFDFIIVETVGVGQSETLVHSMVDFFLVLMLAGAGDELQGVKRGVVEMADAMLITKADGDNLTRAKRARLEYQNALHLFPPLPSGWVPTVELSSALTKLGVAETIEMLNRYENHTKANGHWSRRRQQQLLDWLHDSLREQLWAKFEAKPEIRQAIKEMEQAVLAEKITPSAASAAILGNFYS